MSSDVGHSKGSAGGVGGVTTCVTSPSSLALCESKSESITSNRDLTIPCSDITNICDVNIVFDVVEGRGLPTLPIFFCNFETRALLDSASKLNLINIEFLFKLGFRESDIESSSLRIKGVNGTIKRAFGEINLSFVLMSRMFTDKFVCIEQAEFPADVLLSY